MIRHLRSPVVVLAGAVVAATIVVDGNPSHLDTSVVIATTTLIALSIGVCYGQAGLLSAAQAAFASAGGYASAIVTTRYGVPVAAALPIALVVPGAIAYAVARIVGHLSPFALALATLTLGQLYTVVITEWGTFTGGYVGLSGIPPIPGADTLLELHVVAWVLVGVAVWLYSNLKDSIEGGALRLIAEDRLLATSLGIPVAARASATFALAGAMAGAAGWLYAHSRSYLGPESLPVHLSLTAFIMVVIGGKRAVLGPVVGAAAYVLVTDLLPKAEVQGMFFGAALMVAVLVFPNGILGGDLNAVVRIGARRAPEPARSNGQATVPTRPAAEAPGTRRADIPGVR